MGISSPVCPSIWKEKDRYRLCLRQAGPRSHQGQWPAHREHRARMPPPQGLRASPHPRIVSSAKTKYQMKSGLLLDVVVAQSATVLKLLSSKNQTLLIRGNSLHM